MQCVYTMDWRLFRSWRFKSQLRGARLGFNVFWLALGILTLVLGLGGSMFAAVYLLLAAYCLYMALLRWHLKARVQFRRLAAACGGESWTRVVDFLEDRAAVTDGQVRTEYMYADLGSVTERDGQAVLLFPGKARLVVYPAGFTRGTWAECREILLNHCKANSST